MNAQAIAEWERGTGLKWEGSSAQKRLEEMGLSTPALSGDEREQILIHQSALHLAEKDIRFLDNCRQDLSRELAQAQRKLERIQENNDRTIAEVLELHKRNLAEWQKEKSVLVGALQYIASPRQWLSRLCAKPNETMSVQECAQRALNLTDNGNEKFCHPREPQYRILSIGEILQEGDEVNVNSTQIGNEKWEKLNRFSFGDEVTRIPRYRRPATGDGC